MVSLLALVLQAALATAPYGYTPFPDGTASTLTGDFNGDRRPETAQLFLENGGGRIALWIISDRSNGFPLWFGAATAEWKRTRLSTRGTDMRCVAPDPRPRMAYCRHSYISGHHGAIVVTSPDGREHEWRWNNYAYQRTDIF